jgi:hypothetical protein
MIFSSFSVRAKLYKTRKQKLLYVKKCNVYAGGLGDGIN